MVGSTIFPGYEWHAEAIQEQGEFAQLAMAGEIVQDAVVALLDESLTARQIDAASAVLTEAVAGYVVEAKALLLKWKAAAPV